MAARSARRSTLGARAARGRRASLCTLPLLSKFLLFVVRETLEGRGDEITEHQIGVQVFDRPPDYRTLEDNIVRSYARQLRKRLAEHFADEGSAEPARIDIPLGGYVPVFFPATSDKGGAEAAVTPDGSQQVSMHCPRPSEAARRWRWRLSITILQRQAVGCWARCCPRLIARR